MTLLKPFILFALLFFAASGLAAQSSSLFSFKADIEFAEYLFNEGRQEDAIFFLQKTKDKRKLDINQKDSITFLSASYYYAADKYDSAAKYYAEVSPASQVLFTSALLHNVWTKSALQLYEEGENYLAKVPEDDSLIAKLKKLELSGIALLKNDINSFNRISAGFNPDKTPATIAEAQSDMLNHANSLKALKLKSPALAGILSGVVPGLGKAYNGSTKQAIFTFIPLALLGAQAYHGYSKDGFESPHLYVFGSLFTVFYVGNIWGSVSSVKLKNRYLKNEVKNSILRDMRTPLDKLLL